MQPENESQRSSSGLLNDEAFYELQATDVNGKNINFENYEGYVTVIAALPPKQQGEYGMTKWASLKHEWLLSRVNIHSLGVSQWYYEMLEHLHEVYPYTMEILVVPSDNKRLKIQTVRDPKVSILPKPYAGMLDLLKGALHGTLNDEKKATLYLIGADGNTVEAFVSTNMQDFQRYLRFHFEKDLRKSEF